MKKFVSVILALTMVFAMTACGKTAQNSNDVPAQTAPASALEILESAWAEYAEDEKFAVIGGSMAAPVDGAPGTYDLADENITYSLLIPAEQLANVTEAASMIHMMNANTFTAAVYKLADGVKAADFGAAMKEAVMGNQWMCGFPDKLLISAYGDVYVLVAFGVNDAMGPFQQHFAAAHPGFEVLTDEAIA